MSTIVAISTAPAIGGIGIVRMSGENAFDILSKIFVPKNKQNIEEIKGNSIKYGHIVYEGKIIDEVLVSYFKSPKSYTTEDMCEINSHGNNIILKQILELCIENGAVLAMPGEFTQRAFLNGRIDLTQAESVIDLINAKSEKEKESAIHQLEGYLSLEIEKIKRVILDITADIEASIDYPEYDIEEKTNETIINETQKIVDMLKKLENSFEKGKILRDGVDVAIIGKPNAGKSSLLNAILKEERAIVTNIEGTTRDTIEEFITIKDIPLKIIDTAGIRDTNNAIEKIGVEKTLQAVETADVVLTLVDGTDKTAVSDTAQTWIRNRLREGVTEVLVMNKIDLGVDQGKIPDGAVCISAKTGEGIDALLEKLKKISGNDIDFEGNFSARTRHLTAIAKAKSHLIQVHGIMLSNSPKTN